MPTPAKRIQVQLRAQVLETVESISAEKGLSLSKVVSLLLEEALAHRGMYGDSGANPPPDRSAPSSAKADFDALLQEHSVQTVKNTRGRKITAQRMPELEGPDMDDADEMLRKIKVLKAAGIL